MADTFLIVSLVVAAAVLVYIIFDLDM